MQKKSFEILASYTWCWNWHASFTCMRCMWLFHPWYWEIKKVEQNSIESPWETTRRWSIYVIPQMKGNFNLPSRSLQGVGISQNVAVATLELQKRERIFLLWILFYCDEALSQRKKPPKFSIANGFLIGQIPIITFVDDDGNIQQIDVEKEIIRVTRALLSPLRTHGSVFG